MSALQPHTRILQAEDEETLGDFFVAVSNDPAVKSYFFPHPLTRDYARKVCREFSMMKDRYFAVFVGDFIAGYGMLRGWDEGYSIPSFGVCTHPELRGTGVGNMVMQFAVEEARRLGATDIRLTCNKNNMGVQRLNKKFGFVMVPKDEKTWVGMKSLREPEPHQRYSLDIPALQAWALRRAKPLRVGLWLEYGDTLTPKNGIGVFVFNLIDGLIAHKDKPELVLAVRPGDEHLVADAVAKGRGRVTVIAGPPPVKPQPEPARKPLIYRAVRKAIRLITGDKPQTPTVPLEVDWPYSGTHLSAKEAQCDVWVYPTYTIYPPIADHASVVFVHDLVLEHYPQYFDAKAVKENKRLVRARTAEATIVACMAEFIAAGDIRGRLGITPERVRMIRAAAPKDFPKEQASDAEIKQYQQERQRPFVLYPAGLRGYKNHRILIEALAVPEYRHQLAGLELVFTGGSEIQFRDELLAMAEELGLAGRVHIYDCVSREKLAWLYQHAMATMVPTLYEQGSFPIYESLHYGCPVASSNIASLQEQCAPLAEAMLHFNPHNATEVAQTMVQLLTNREAIRTAQMAKAEAVWKRTWNDVADNWLAVFRQAAVEHGMKQTVKSAA